MPFYFGNISSALPLARAGRVRALAVTSPQRSPAAPEVPTTAESGVAGCEISERNALLVPAGTPPVAIDRLNAEVVKILRQDDIRAKFTDLGTRTIGSTPAGQAKGAEVSATAKIKIE